MNKITLKYELDLDFILIAITSPLKDYRLCHFINKHTGLRLKSVSDYTLPSEGREKTRYFRRFRDESLERETYFYLLTNRGIEGGFLVPELKASDYFILIKGFIDEEDLENLLQDLNSIQDVVVASEIFPEKLKSKENLVF